MHKQAEKKKKLWEAQEPLFPFLLPFTVKCPCCKCKVHLQFANYSKLWTLLVVKGENNLILSHSPYIGQQGGDKQREDQWTKIPDLSFSSLGICVILVGGEIRTSIIYVNQSVFLQEAQFDLVSLGAGPTGAFVQSICGLEICLLTSI